MEIKGSAVKSIVEFIKKNHPDSYQDWLNSLPEESKRIFTEPVLPSNWYPMNESAVIPTRHLAELFFNGDMEKGAWESGRYSAQSALTGIYKFFIMAVSPFFIISKASRILSTYYRPSEIEVIEKGDNWVLVDITKFEEPSEIIECRICGWIQRALEISGAKNVKIEVRRTMTRGDELTELYISWD
ncbi:MAG: hypothetical protein JW723_14920 [Bacteroidales bacterium]|nr:hypothetical protein [Bacteroidales bacterium]